MGPAISCCLRWNCWRSWRLWFPRPGSISYATTGSWRPGPGPATSSCRPSRWAEPSAADGAASAASCGHRLRWATLLARVFSSDLSECAACGGRLRIIAALTDPASIRPYLEGVGLPVRPPPRAPPEPLSSWPPDLPFRPVAVAGGTAGCAFNGPSGPGLIRIRADRQPDRTASSVEGWANDPLRELPDPGGALSALTESPKKCLIFPILHAPNL